MPSVNGELANNAVASGCNFSETSSLRTHVGFGRVIQIHLHGASARHHVQAERADLLHVAAHDRVAPLGHPRHGSAGGKRMEAKRGEADPQIARRTSKLVVMRLQLRLGLMQGDERRTGQFELTRRFERDRSLVLAKSDHIVVIQDRLPGGPPHAFQQVANCAWMSVRRQIGRRRQIGQAKAEFLVLGANADTVPAACSRRR